MKTAFTNAFLRDIRKLPNDGTREQVRNAILMIEAAPDLRSIRNLRKLSGGGRYYRIRVGDHRVGVTVDGEVVTLVRVLPRKEIYRYFRFIADLVATCRGTRP